MNVFKTTLKRLLRNKVQLLLMIVIPIIPLIPTNMLGDMQSTPKNIGIVDNDKTAVAQLLETNLKGNFNIKKLNENEINSALYNSEVKSVVVIPKEYTSGILEGKLLKIKLISTENDDISPLVKAYINNFNNKILASSKGCKSDVDLVNKFNEFNKDILSLDITRATKIDKSRSKISLGLIIQFIMFSSVLASTLLLKDKEDKIFYRNLAAPMSNRKYLFETILSFITIGLLQLIILLLFSKFVLKLYVGDSYLNAFIYMLIATVMSSALGMAISAHMKTVIQALGFGIIIVTVLNCLGGAWGAAPTGQILNVAKLTPVYWAIDGIESLVNNKGLEAITNNMLIMVLFTMLFFLLGIWKKKEVISY